MAPFSKLEQAVYYDDDSSLESSSCIATPAEDMTVSSSSTISTSTASRGSSVSFSPDVATHFVLHIHDYSLAERRNSWYGVQDMRRFRQEWKDIVEIMEQRQQRRQHHHQISNVGHDDDHDDESLELCFRGLEGKTCIGKRRRREARSASLEVVLDEQVFCQSMDNGVPDPLMIAMAYSECTFLLQVEAFRQAQKDAIVVGSQLPEEEVVEPTKFDFRAVSAKFRLAYNSDDDAAMVTTIATGQSDSGAFSSKNIGSNGNQFTGMSFRNKMSCFFPLAPNRFGQRKYQRRSIALRGDV